MGRKPKRSEGNQKVSKIPKILEGKQNKISEGHQKSWKGNFDTSRRIIMLLRSLINSLWLLECIVLKNTPGKSGFFDTKACCWIPHDILISRL